MVNDPATVFVRRHRGRSGYHDEVFHDDDHVVRTLTKLLDDASSAHRKLDPADGLQDAQLDDGARVHIVHGDVARGGHVLVNIRKFTGIPFASLDELVERGMLTARVAAFLRACVRARLSIVFAGHPGAGKTTLMSCTAAELDPALRVVVAEEVFEADIPLPNVAHMQTRAARSDREPVDLRRLVAGFLRMAPDVAIVGEMRDREGFPELRSHGWRRLRRGSPAPRWHVSRRYVRTFGDACARGCAPEPSICFGYVRRELEGPVRSPGVNVAAAAAQASLYRTRGDSRVRDGSATPCGVGSRPRPKGRRLDTPRPQHSSYREQVGQRRRCRAPARYDVEHVRSCLAPRCRADGRRAPRGDSSCGL